MSEQKRNHKESIFCFMPTPNQKNFQNNWSFFVYHIQSQEKFYKEKDLFKKKESGGLNKKQKEGFLITQASAIKKDPTMSIRKHTNELKVYEKTVRTAIK